VGKPGNYNHKNLVFLLFGGLKIEVAARSLAAFDALGSVDWETLARQPPEFLLWVLWTLSMFVQMFTGVQQ
jgi:hypothetical protein